MRKYVVPVLCAVMMAGLGVVSSGCASDPPPAAKSAKKARKSKKPPQVTFEFVGEALKLPGPVVFETGSDRLSPVSDEVLQIVADYMHSKPEVTRLRIEGHTDSDGSAGANQTLSEHRAMAVTRWLADVGIDCRRLYPVGFGQTRPIAPNDTMDHKAQNRRVAFVNAEVRGRPLGGMPVSGGGILAGDPCR